MTEQNLDEEKFVPITSRDDLSGYRINRKGQLLNMTNGQLLKGTINDSGYRSFTVISDSGKKVRVYMHNLVAREFIPNPDPETKTQVNHKDEDKLNNHWTNLEWMTPKENVNHGTAIERRREHRKKPVNEYDLEGHYIRTWKSVRDVVRFLVDVLNLPEDKIASVENSIQGCCKGRQKSSGGRVWRLFDGAIDDIKAPVGTINRIGLRHSRSGISLVYDGKIPDEHLFVCPSLSELRNHFLNHTWLNRTEKMWLKSIFDAVRE